MGELLNSESRLIGLDKAQFLCPPVVVVVVVGVPCFRFYVGIYAPSGNESPLLFFLLFSCCCCYLLVELRSMFAQWDRLEIV